MKRFACACVLAFPLAVFAQEYVEASGQTAVFELKAGATAPWNPTGIFVVPSSAVRHSPIGLSIFRDNGIVFKLSGKVPAGKAVLTISALNGTVVEKIKSSPSNTFHLTRHIANGCYLASVAVSGTTILTTNILAAR